MLGCLGLYLFICKLEVKIIKTKHHWLQIVLLKISIVQKVISVKIRRHIIKTANGKTKPLYGTRAPHVCYT